MGHPVTRNRLGLTPRQTDVARCALEGYTAEETAERLGLSLGTVKVHRLAVFKRLAVSTISQLFIEVNRRAARPLPVALFNDLVAERRR
jgi:DNA-binding CsgD family transcriptional regulator